MKAFFDISKNDFKEAWKTHIFAVLKKKIGFLCTSAYVLVCLVTKMYFNSQFKF